MSWNFIRGLWTWIHWSAPDALTALAKKDLWSVDRHIPFLPSYPPSLGIFDTWKHRFKSFILLSQIHWEFHAVYCFGVSILCLLETKFPSTSKVWDLQANLPASVTTLNSLEASRESSPVSVLRGYDTSHGTLVRLSLLWCPQPKLPQRWLYFQRQINYVVYISGHIQLL